MPEVGSLAIGFVIGVISMFFVSKATDTTPGNLAAFIGVILGGAALEFVLDNFGGKTANYALYAVGLAIGIVFYTIFYRARTGQTPAIFTSFPSFFR